MLLAVIYYGEDNPVKAKQLFYIVTVRFVKHFMVVEKNFERGESLVAVLKIGKNSGEKEIIKEFVKLLLFFHCICSFSAEYIGI
jgi:hypothetical protein